ncbi:MAG: ECF-type sigma factor [Acidobacteriota bacterium]
MQLDKEVTRWLEAWSAGEVGALDRLLPLVWDDLRGMARRYLLHERENHTLQPTALVHEVYLRLADRRRLQWANRAQFFASMAEIMRFVLVDHARRKRALRHGAGQTPAPFDESFDTSTLWSPTIRPPSVDLIALDTALNRLAELDERQARIVELRYFCGLTIAETARALEISTMTVKRDWHSARLFLLREMGDS